MATVSLGFRHSLIFTGIIHSAMRYLSTRRCVIKVVLSAWEVTHTSGINQHFLFFFSDIMKIDRYCKKRYIELLPHIESLSGFSQW